VWSVQLYGGIFALFTELVLRKGLCGPCQPYALWLQDIGVETAEVLVSVTAGTRLFRRRRLHKTTETQPCPSSQTLAQSESLFFELTSKIFAAKFMVSAAILVCTKFSPVPIPGTVKFMLTNNSAISRIVSCFVPS